MKRREKEEGKRTEEVRKRRKGERDEKKKDVPSGIEPRTLCTVVQCWAIAVIVHVHTARHGLSVISINSDTYACLTFHLDSCRAKDIRTVVNGSRGADCSCSCVGTLQLHGCGFACCTYSANNNTNIPQIPGIQWVLHCTSVILVS